MLVIFVFKEIVSWYNDCMNLPTAEKNAKGIYVEKTRSADRGTSLGR